MTLALYSIAALPVWAAIFYLYFLLRRHKLMKESLVAKCAGSFLSVGSALIALYTAESPSLPGFVLLFFLFCTGADALLEISFLPGMGLFAAGHIVLILALWQSFPPTLWSLLLGVVAFAAAAFLFRRELPKMGLVALPACLYVGVISCMLALCLPLPFLRGGPGGWCAAAGALCFFISDLMVAKGHFGHLGSKYQELIMLLYWAALFLLSVLLW